MTTKNFFLPVSLGLALLGSGQLLASQLDFDTSYLVVEEPRNPGGHETVPVSTATLSSNLKIASKTDLVNVDLDYRLEGRLREEEHRQEGNLSQQIDASLNSSLVNEYLKANASITSNNLIDQNGDAYRFSVKPALTKSLNEYSDLGVYYHYRVDRNPTAPAADTTEELAFDLSGDMVGGRLTWKGRYLASSVGRAGVDRPENLEAVDFESRFRVSRSMQLDLSWAFKNRHLLNDSQPVEYDETLYAAGVAWTPSQYYSVSMKVRKRDETPFSESGYFGVGSLTWSPAKRLRFSVNYDDQFFEGAGGWQFNTSLDL